MLFQAGFHASFIDKFDIGQFGAAEVAGEVDFGNLKILV